MICKDHPDYDPKNSIDGQKGLHKNCLTCQGLYYDSKKIGYFSGELGNIDRANVIVGPLNSSERGILRYRLSFDFHFEGGRVKLFNVEKNNIYVETNNPESLIKYLKEKGLSGKIKEEKFVDV